MSTPRELMNDPAMEPDARRHDVYWRSCLRIVAAILTVWAGLSLGCGILFRKWLDENLPTIGHAPFGFWMAQQGAIIGFVVLLLVYMVLMNRLDDAHGFGGDDE